ncbi:type II secretion system F family protein, partial [Candidatus Sumerlaeota bacterium]|nr:type II secretion system F family protein [Candidatus Sumerlaeota bacterium]
TPAFEIGEHPMEEDAPLFAREIHFFGPSNLDRAVFCRQLATLIEVGIPLLKALQMLSRRTAHAKLAEAISRVARGVEEGQSVSDAMRENEQVFSPLVCNLIKVGEQGGMLETSLIRLAQIMESRADIKRKLVAAMAYPAVALCVAFAVIVLILVKAVPVFTSVYGEAGADLPPLTQVVIGVSNFVTGWFWIWLPLLVVAIAAAIWYGRTPEGKHLYSLLALRVPGLSRVTQKIAVARFSSTLGGLLASGIPLIESVSIAAETNENRVIGDALRSVHSGVEKGEKMTRPLAKADIFPPLVVDMISIGEETGTLDRMLDKIADIYEADVDSALRGLATIIEPLLIVFLGGVVIVIALAVMLPYFHLVEIV